MWPSNEQIAWAAYMRWLRRGCAHGHDRHDWVAAENDLLFSLNYQVVAHARADQLPPVAARPDRCRFCETTTKTKTTRRGPTGGPLGLGAALAGRECDDCRANFATSLDPHLDRFLSPFRDVPSPRGLIEAPRQVWGLGPAADRPTCAVRNDGAIVLSLAAPSHVPIVVYKALTRLALLLMPEADLLEYSGALEWVTNPDHAQDIALLGELNGTAYLAPARFPAPWATLARKIDRDAPVPGALLLAGLGHAAIQLAVPCGEGDADVDEAVYPMPRVTMPGGLDAPPQEAPSWTIPLGLAGPRPAGHLVLVYRPGTDLGAAFTPGPCPLPEMELDCSPDGAPSRVELCSA